MMENRFDELAKALAGGVSRREALRRFAGGLAGAMLASLGLGRRAFGDPGDEGQGPGGEGQVGQAPQSECEAACEDICGLTPGAAESDFGKCVSSCESCLAADGQVCACPPQGSAEVVCCLTSLAEICCDGRCCHAEQSCCSEVCTSILSDNNNCGMCGNVCAELLTCCLGSCVDTLSDDNNCGECENVCPGDTICIVGHCCSRCGSLLCCLPDACCTYVISTPTGGTMTAQNCCPPCPAGKTLDCATCACT